eukprot:112506-Karenia_brevis.AAC.1
MVPIGQVGPIVSACLELGFRPQLREWSTLWNRFGLPLTGTGCLFAWLWQKQQGGGVTGLVGRLDHH